MNVQHYRGHYMTPTTTNASLGREINQNDHAVVLFDSPNIGSLMSLMTPSDPFLPC